MLSCVGMLKCGYGIVVVVAICMRERGKCWKMNELEHLLFCSFKTGDGGLMWGGIILQGDVG